jgi:GR25 family glycosyltransferase involved in LPS biosynthesis
MKPIYKVFLLYLVLSLIISVYLIFKIYKNEYRPSAKSILQKAKDYYSFLINNNKYRLYKHRNKDQIIFPILYINLNSSVDRRNHMENQFEQYGIKNYKRIEAIEGKNINDIKRGHIQGLNFVNDYHTMKKSELGCTLSHIKAMITALQDNNDIVLILEDDCNFLLYDMWPVSTLRELVNKSPTDWEIIQLFSFYDGKNGSVFIDKTNKIHYSTVSYLINKKGIKKILDYCEFNPKTGFIRLKNSNLIPPDHGLYETGIADVYLYAIVKSYLYTPNLFIPSDFMFSSTIDRSHEKEHVDSIIYTLDKYFEFNFIEDVIKAEKQFIFAEVLCDMDDYLKSLRVPYMIGEGTLLGIYREEKFIERDYDIDLIIFFQDYNQAIEKDSEKFKLRERHGQISTGYELKFVHKKYNILIDLIFIYPEINKKQEIEYFWLPTFCLEICTNSKLGFCRWKCPIFKREEIDFIGRKFGVPGNPEKYLIERYGINWNTPIKYNYEQSINYSLTKGLIKTDLKSTLKEPEKEIKICDLYPRKIREMSKSKPIIWLYWENMKGKNKPHYLNLCYKTIEKYAGNKFHIIILNPKNIPTISRSIHKNFININPIGMRADYVRFCIVAEYGGIWLDSDVILTSDLSLMTNTLKNYNFVSFYHKNEEDISIGIFGGNKDNRICLFYKHIFENGKYPWQKKKVKMLWTWGAVQRENFMKNMKKFGYNEYKTFYAPTTVEPTDWKISKNYYWTKGNLDNRFDNLAAVYLHNHMYSDDQKNMSEEKILNGDLRISHLFRKVLG